jgi:photosystem II stability/assembly factor-like uncharacterized protein
MKTPKLFLCVITLVLTSCDNKNIVDSAASAGTPLNYELIPAGTKNNLHSVFFINSQTGYIAGDSGLVLKTTDGGTVWTPATPVTHVNLYCVSFSSDTGFVFGDSMTVLRTTNGGSSWVKLWYNHFFNNNLRTGYCISGQSFEMGGDQFYGFSKNSINFLYYIPESYYYRSLKRVSDSICIVVGDNGIIRRRNTLINFSLRDIVSPTSNNLNGLTFINGNIGFAVGDNSTVVRTEDGGNSWQLMRSTSYGKLNDVHFTSPSHGVIIGVNGLFYATSDSGRNWWQYSMPSMENLNSICSIDGQKRIIVGDGGTILREN